MQENKVRILNSQQISQKLNRLAYQVLEDNLEEPEIVFAGIQSRGFKLAKKLQQIFSQISPIPTRLMSISLDKDSSHLQASTDLELELVKDKVVILIDDVLNSGRTLVYGLGVFMNVPLKKLRILVLVDRSHRIFPVAADFTGHQLATVLKEHVSVVIDEPGQEDAVYLS